MNLHERYASLVHSIEQACRDSQRNPASVRLLVVSKAQTLSRILEVHALGPRHFGENYAQELFAKAEQAPTALSWSFIGQLQSNKIKRIVQYADEIQSLCSRKHLALIARYAEDLGKCPYPVFLEVHCPGDQETKGGLSFEELDAFVEEVQTHYFQQIALQGLMAVPPQNLVDPWTSEAELLYKQLRQKANKVGAGKLSLGMSADFKHAIRLGADVIRIGSLLMGARVKNF